MTQVMTYCIFFFFGADVCRYVHSLSVGAPEGEVGPAIIGRMNQEMMALGARGVSIVFASGDSGYNRQQKYAGTNLPLN